MANRVRLRMRMDSQSQSHALSRGGCALQRSCLLSSLAAGQTGGGGVRLPIKLHQVLRGCQLSSNLDTRQGAPMRQAAEGSLLLRLHRAEFCCRRFLLLLDGLQSRVHPAHVLEHLGDLVALVAPTATARLVIATPFCSTAPTSTIAACGVALGTPCPDSYDSELLFQELVVGFAPA